MFSKNSIISIIAVLISQNLVLAAPTSGKSYGVASTVGYKSLNNVPGALRLNNDKPNLSNEIANTSNIGKVKPGFEVADVLREPLESGENSVGYKRPSKTPGYENESSEPAGSGSGSNKPNVEYAKNPSEVDSEEPSTINPDESNEGLSSGDSSIDGDIDSSDGYKPNEDIDSTGESIPLDDIESSEDNTATSGNYPKDKAPCDMENGSKNPSDSSVGNETPEKEAVVEEEIPSKESDTTEGEGVESPGDNPEDQGLTGNSNNPSEDIDSSEENEYSPEVPEIENDTEGEVDESIEEIDNDIPSIELNKPVYENSNNEDSIGSNNEGSGSTKPTGSDENNSGDISYAKPSAEGTGSIKPTKPTEGSGSTEPIKPGVTPSKPAYGYKRP